MLRLSRTSEYAIRGLVILASISCDEPVTIEEVSKSDNMPPNFLAKIFQTLSKKGILRSVRGREGGVVLAKPPEQISLLEVIEAVEGPIILTTCLLFKDFCPRLKICPLHDVWNDGLERFTLGLKDTNIKQLVEKGRLLSQRR